MIMLTREYAALRAAEVRDDGRTLVVACVPIDQPSWVSDGGEAYREVFRPGAFRHVASAPNRVELRYRHDRTGAPYGFGVELEEASSRSMTGGEWSEPERYLLGTFRIAPSAHGDQLLALVRDEQLTGVSIGYVAGQSRDSVDADGPVVERLNVRQLMEVSLTNAPAYADARVLAVREESHITKSVMSERERERIRWQRFRMSL